MSEPAIQVQQLQKGFGEIKAVQGISFDIAQGDLFSSISIF